MAARGAWPLFAFSLAAWAMLTAFTPAVPAHSDVVWVLCAARLPGLYADVLPSRSPSLADVPWRELGAVSADWILMLCAMTAPLLWPQLNHLRTRTLRQRHGRAMALFLSGYAGVWLLALIAIWLVAMALRLLPASVCLMGAVAIALLWQGTIIKARSLLRCHELPPLPAFGLAAERASIRFGLRTGWSCACACWALMLPAMTTPALHVVGLMVASTIAMTERYGPMKRPQTRPSLILAGTALLMLSSLG